MVMSPLKKMFLRSFKKNSIQLLSIALMLILGVAIYIGIDSTWRSLNDYVETNYRKENKADIEVLIKPTNKDFSRLGESENIKQLEEQFLIEGAIIGSDGKEVLINGVDQEAKLNQYTIVKGKNLNKQNTVVIDKSFAEANHLDVGDKLTIEINSLEKEVSISGLAVSSSYIYITPDSTTVVPNHEDYGFIYMNKKDTKNFTQNNAMTNKLVIKVADGKNVETVKKEIEQKYEQEIISILESKETLNDLATSQKVQQYQSIGNLFPIIFFAIVILMSFTTMYRLINKERAIIGTMKALGYSSFKIITHYLFYGIWMSIIGVFFGVLIGWKVIPNYIWRFFNELFIFDHPEIVINGYQVAIITALSVFSTCVATLIVFYNVEKESPASLLREKSTTKGYNILLERIKPFWNGLKTSQKLTLRQMFRSKIRMSMTIIGVVGCTSLLLSALGIRDTINHVASSVYEKSYLYEEKAYVASDTDSRELYDKTRSNKEIEGLEERPYFILSDSKNKSGLIHVIEDSSSYIKFYDDDKQVNLSEDRLLITKKTAEIFSLNKGDAIQFRNTAGDLVKLKVTDIAELSIGQGFYLTKSAWEKADQVFVPTSFVGKNLKTTFSNDEMKKIVLTKNQENDFLGSMGSTLSMSILLILSASLLLTVVLYNLGTLNFSDRERDMATLSVLGFRFSELKKILSTENIILSLCGIIIGIPFGIKIHEKIFSNAGMGDELYFRPVIDRQSYLITIIFTIVLIIIVNYLSNRKINKIKMTEALKSVE
ncbi:hypothetical protein UAW_03234 [Enterococcus haemoperoxidus ATCC BAA-382]|uniref:ABC3 transporter permease protein domain-containing protein n=1 Tax=Enterococcus haemoperoxidus ATCC BAA-382 TaxID=1158608 RepID=R2SVZ2_9ENTE|nr:FtsX-like permease family protein [Enterococcus haemoperoxidus]EOH92249.1 hypothetical protein UAW_03234 [Enterococcus haemoperoxidus ATCC BAA-382]EOT61934.1 hypothetical protein I583_00917 [Enterococcus haemoperoxidus ATCC BAA-382]